MRMHSTTPTTILAIDLGKRKAIYCDYVFGTESGVRRFGTVTMNRQAMHDLLVERAPDRLVIEIGPAAGWIHDLARTLGIDVDVANTNHEAWRWKHAKRKTDRRDAQRLAELSAMNQLPTVYMPSAEVRAWRTLITYRRTLVARRARIKNNIRAILDREGLTMPAGKKGWTNQSIAALRELASFDDGSLWRFELGIELDGLAPLSEQIRAVEKKLESIARHDPRVQRLKTAPAVGDRLSEAVVAVIDDPNRFTRGRDVGCYVGLTPRLFQSSEMSRSGRISKDGNALLRTLLVECAWMGVARFKVEWMVEAYENVRRGSEKRKKVAIVAVARKLLIRCWAMMRDESPWRDPQSLQRSSGENEPTLKLAA